MKHKSEVMDNNCTSTAAATKIAVAATLGVESNGDTRHPQTLSSSIGQRLAGSPSLAVNQINLVDSNYDCYQVAKGSAGSKQQNNRCYLCDTPKQEYSLIRSYCELICRGCLNYEGPDRIEWLISEARHFKKSHSFNHSEMERQTSPPAPPSLQHHSKQQEPPETSTPNCHPLSSCQVSNKNNSIPQAKQESKSLSSLGPQLTSTNNEANSEHSCITDEELMPSATKNRPEISGLHSPRSTAEEKQRLPQGQQQNHDHDQQQQQQPALSGPNVGDGQSPAVRPAKRKRQTNSTGKEQLRRHEKGCEPGQGLQRGDDLFFQGPVCTLPDCCSRSQQPTILEHVAMSGSGQQRTSNLSSLLTAKHPAYSGVPMPPMSTGSSAYEARENGLPLSIGSSPHSFQSSAVATYEQLMRLKMAAVRQSMEAAAAIDSNQQQKGKHSGEPLSVQEMIAPQHQHQHHYHQRHHPNPPPAAMFVQPMGTNQTHVSNYYTRAASQWRPSAAAANGSSPAAVPSSARQSNQQSGSVHGEAQQAAGYQSPTSTPIVAAGALPPPQHQLNYMSPAAAAAAATAAYCTAAAAAAQQFSSHHQQQAAAAAAASYHALTNAGLPPPQHHSPHSFSPNRAAPICMGSTSGPTIASSSATTPLSLSSSLRLQQQQAATEGGHDPSQHDIGLRRLLSNIEASTLADKGVPSSDMGGSPVSNIRQSQQQSTSPMNATCKRPASEHSPPSRTASECASEATLLMVEAASPESKKAKRDERCGAHLQEFQRLESESPEAIMSDEEVNVECPIEHEDTNTLGSGLEVGKNNSSDGAKSQNQMQPRSAAIERRSNVDESSGSRSASKRAYRLSSISPSTTPPPAAPEAESQAPPTGNRQKQPLANEKKPYQRRTADSTRSPYKMRSATSLASGQAPKGSTVAPTATNKRNTNQTGANGAARAPKDGQSDGAQAAPQAAQPATKGTGSSCAALRCLICRERLEDRHFVQCPSAAAHKFCFACSKNSIERQRLENKALGISSSDKVYCPSGKRCFLATEQTPWTFMNSEIETIFRDTSTQAQQRTNYHKTTRTSPRSENSAINSSSSNCGSGSNQKRAQHKHNGPESTGALGGASYRQTLNSSASSSSPSSSAALGQTNCNPTRAKHDLHLSTSKTS